MSLIHLMRRPTVVVVALIGMLAVASPAWAATDPARAQQWALDRIKADNAWAASTGSGITIAIVDSGIDLTHPDLKSKITSHYDCRGGTCRTGGDDDFGHGSHVAGIAAASTHNGIGVSGVAPAAKLMAVKVLGSDGKGNCSDIAVGIRWAADHGARVINLSLGPELPGILATLLQGDCISSLEDAAAYAWNKGNFVVIAAGNSGLKSVYSSSALEVVGATDRNDQPASYSNNGADVYAPGGDASSCTSSTCILSTYKDGGYALEQGTSMAAPHVSGLAALLMARGYTNSQVRQRLASTADHVNGLLRINVTRAVGPAAASPTSTLKSTLPPSLSRNYASSPPTRTQTTPSRAAATPSTPSVGIDPPGSAIAQGNIAQSDVVHTTNPLTWIGGATALLIAIAGGVALRRTSTKPE